MSRVERVSCGTCFTNIQVRSTLKRVRDMIITCSQIHRAGKYSKHSSIIWIVWLNRWLCLCDRGSNPVAVT